jgi:hypothetical protein
MSLIPYKEINIQYRDKLPDGKDDYGYVIERIVLGERNILMVGTQIKALAKYYGYNIDDQDVHLIRDALEDAVHFHLWHEPRKNFAKKHGMIKRVVHGEFLVHPFKGIELKKTRTIEEFKRTVNKEAVINILRHIIPACKEKSRYKKELERNIVERLDMSRQRPKIIFRRRRIPKMEYTRVFKPKYYGREVHPFDYLKKRK